MESGLAEVAMLGAGVVERPGVQRLSHTHEDIARWMLANPTRPLKECATYFGYTQSWLSCIIHSDAFQARLRKLQDGADAVTLLDVPARLRGVAAATLDGLGVQVEHALKETEGNGILHRQFLLDTAEVTLKALGFGGQKTAPSPAPFFQQNNFNVGAVPPETLARARETLLNAVEVTPEISETSKLPAGGESDLRTVQRQPATVPAAAGAEGEEAARVDL
jgi:hypothetical protein